MKIRRTRKSGRQQERKTNENPGEIIKLRKKMKIKKHEDQERKKSGGK